MLTTMVYTCLNYPSLNRATCCSQKIFIARDSYLEQAMIRHAESRMTVFFHLSQSQELANSAGCYNPFVRITSAFEFSIHDG